MTEEIKTKIIEQQRLILTYTLFDQLFHKFIYELPEEVLNSKIRLCFQLRYAYWEYCDTLEKTYVFLPHFENEKDFFSYCYMNSDFLAEKLNENIESVYRSFIQYEKSIPVYGSILIDTSLTQCLLIQNSVKGKTYYSFPKGKVDFGETEEQCAIRETFEETGYDISPFMQKDLYLEFKTKTKYMKFFIIFNVPTYYNFKPTSQHEIECLKWYQISNLPLSGNFDNIKKELINIVNIQFYKTYCYNSPYTSPNYDIYKIDNIYTEIYNKNANKIKFSKFKNNKNSIIYNQKTYYV
jgi:8-oxo-dGTP pyrophosphatase MutT (NUDIX family)